jgi:NhaA family Na+:H+ antiporter
MLAGIAVLGGMGFTMSLFVANLAYLPNHPEMLSVSKIGVLTASTIAGILGWGILRMVTPRPAEA